MVDMVRMEQPQGMHHQKGGTSGSPKVRPNVELPKKKPLKLYGFMDVLDTVHGRKPKG